MKRISATLLICALTLVTSSLTQSAAPILLPDDCSCTAPDGSCSASVSCQGGCTYHCADNGDCSAQCSGFYAVFGTQVTFQIQNGRYPQLVTELARISGRDLVFTPAKPDAVFNAEYKKAVLWDILETLSDRGTVQIAGQDFEKIKRLRRALLSGERISFGVRNTPVSTFVNDTASLTGLPLRIASGNPMAMANVKLQYATLNDILFNVSEQTSTKIVEEGVDSGVR